MSGDEPAAAFGITDAEMDAIMERGKAGQLTGEDQAKIATVASALSESLPLIADMFNDLLGGFGSLFDSLGGLVAAANEWLDELGVDARVEAKPTYRTEPIPGAELGGSPRNPEADVIDEIDRLVDWQLESGDR